MGGQTRYTVRNHVRHLFAVLCLLSSGLLLASHEPLLLASHEPGETLTAGAPAPQPRTVAALPSFLRGMTVSCPRYGQIWASASMTESLRELSALGVEWVAIHPYAGIRRDGSMRVTPAAETGYLPGAVQIAREEGIHLFWKPHLAYWGSFEWRGEIQFGEDEKAWQRFFDGYRRFIVDHARFAEASGIQLFAVGTELEATTHRETEWRRIVAEVRQVYSGRLTYAANWDRVDKVPFWDAVDWIGVQAYHPLSDRQTPDRGTLVTGWESHLRELETLSRRTGKKVLFTEIGYDRSTRAALEPWARGTAERGVDSDEARALRARLIEVALERLPREPWLAGIFWWKWMPGHPYRWDRGDRDFSMRAPEARQALERFWGPRTGARERAR